MYFVSTTACVSRAFYHSHHSLLGCTKILCDILACCVILVADTKREMALSYQFITEGRPGAVSVGKLSAGIHVSWHIESSPSYKWHLVPPSALLLSTGLFRSPHLSCRKRRDAD